KRFDESPFHEADEWIAAYYLKLGDEENYLKIRMQNLDTERQYLELADYWKAKGEDEKYISTLEDWVTKLTDKKEDSSRYYYLTLEDGILNRLAAVYEKDDAELCRILVVKAHHEAISLDLYKQIETVAKRLNKWRKLKGSILEAAKRNSKVLAQ